MSSFYYLRNLSRIRKYLTRDCCNYCTRFCYIEAKLLQLSSLWLTEVPNKKVTDLQYVQNTAARIVCRIGKYEHITPVLMDLHWFPVHYRIVFKILLLVYKTINGMSPRYLTDLLQFRESSRSLRSVSNELLSLNRGLLRRHMVIKLFQFVHLEFGIF
jgi:hypothetical protein